MWSFVVVDLKNQLDINEFVTFIDINYPQSQILYCSSKKVDNQSLSNYIFDESVDSESVINSVTVLCENQNIAIIRDVKNYPKIIQLSEKLKHKNQIVYFEKKSSKFISKCSKFFLGIINYIFNQNIKPIYYGLCVYGENASKILKNIESPSVITKTNTFAGVEYLFVDCNYEYKFNYNNKNVALKTLLPLSISLILLIVKLATGFKVNTVLSLLYYSAVVLGIIFFLVFGMVWFVKSQIGDNIKSKAEILNIKQNLKGEKNEKD